jgi:MFS transporter, DHA2 family, methylenomycin A resistance protein
MTATMIETPATTEARSGRSSVTVLLAALLGFFVITLDASVVNVALPAMGTGLHSGLAGLQWVVDGYTLMFAALLLSAGALSDRIGASRAFVAGLSVFTIASMLCGVAPNLGILVGARVVQGAAAAVMLPASLALVRQAYPDPAKRARAIAVWTVGGSVAIAAGPVAGGLLTSVWSWRAIFFINLPVGILGLVMAARSPRSERRPAPLDLTGQVTAVLALAALTYAVIEGGHAGWSTPQVLAALVVSVVAAAAFGAVESRSKRPMVPLEMFRSVTVSFSVAVGFALNVAFFGTVFVFSLYFQDQRGDSPLETGLMFVPMTMLIAVLNLGSARLADRYGPRVPIAVGQSIMVLGLLGLATVHAHTSAVLLMVLLAPLGIGGALTVPPLTAVLLDSVPAERAGLAAGVFNAGRQIGGGLAVATFGALLAHRSTFQTGMTTSLLIGAGLLLLSLTATVILLGPRTRRP